MHCILDGHRVIPEPDLLAWGKWMEANKYQQREKEGSGSRCI